MGLTHVWQELDLCQQDELAIGPCLAFICITVHAVQYHQHHEGSELVACRMAVTRISLQQYWDRWPRVTREDSTIVLGVM